MQVIYNTKGFSEQIRENICNEFLFDFESKDSGDLAMSAFLKDYGDFINK